MKDLQSEKLKTRIYFRFLKFQSSCGKFAGYLEQNCKSKYWSACFKVYVVLWTKKKSQLDGVYCLIQHNVNTHVFKNTLNIWLLISTSFPSRPIVLLPVLLLPMLAKHVMTWWVEFLNPPMLECLQWTIMFQLPMGPPHSIHFSQTILDPIVTKIVVSIEYHT